MINPVHCTFLCISLVAPPLPLHPGDRAGSSSQPPPPLPPHWPSTPSRLGSAANQLTRQGWSSLWCRQLTSPSQIISLVPLAVPSRQLTRPCAQVPMLMTQYLLGSFTYESAHLATDAAIGDLCDVTSIGFYTTHL